MESSIRFLVARLRRQPLQDVYLKQLNDYILSEDSVFDTGEKMKILMLKNQGDIETIDQYFDKEGALKVEYRQLQLNEESFLRQEIRKWDNQNIYDFHLTPKDEELLHRWIIHIESKRWHFSQKEIEIDWLPDEFIDGLKSFVTTCSKLQPKSRKNKGLSYDYTGWAAFLLALADLGIITTYPGHTTAVLEIENKFKIELDRSSLGKKKLENPDYWRSGAIRDQKTQSLVESFQRELVKIFPKIYEGK